VRRLVVLDLIGAVLVLVVAVTAWRVWGPAGPERHGPLVVKEAPWFDAGEFGFLAYLGGEVRIDGDCAYLGDDPVVWPTGTRWVERAHAVQLASGELLHEGDRVSGGGGAWRLDELTGLDDLLAACARPDTEILVFNTHEQLDVVRG
jgi:hypothetical protein